MIKGFCDPRIQGGLINQDFFDFVPGELTDQTGLVAINPPYGKRLENRAKSEALFIRICARLKQEFTGWQVILISPNRHLAQQVPFRLEAHAIFHGGLRPVLLTGTIA